MVTNRIPLLLALALLSAPFLAGCIGQEDGSTDEPVEKQRADVDEKLGGIEGVVTDTAIQPVEGANVTIMELGKSTETASDGSFALSLVEPGSYTVSVRTDGFVSAQDKVTVTAGEVSTIDFVVTRTISKEAYVQPVEWHAFIECGVGAGVNLSAAGYGSGGATLAACGVPNSVLGGSTTNDDFIERPTFDPPLHTWVWEATWDTGGNALAENLWLVSEIQGHFNTADPNASVYEDISTPSPFKARVEKPHFENISANFKTQCEDGDDSYCGYNFAGKGWPMVIRTFTAFDCVPAPATACAPFQVQVDHVFTGFYNAPAPEGYSVYGGGN